MENKVRRALIPGSFDPVTKGHESLIRRAAELFEEVYVVLFRNPEKTGLFTHEERLAFLRAVCEKYPTVSVGEDDGMVADYVKTHAISAIVKGARNEKDFLYELPMALYNRKNGGAETLLLYPEEGTEEISSSAVRERIATGISPRELLPDEITRKIDEKFGFTGKMIDK